MRLEVSRLGTLARALVSVALGASGAVAPSLAHANGAFPDSLSLMAPADNPARIVLATNFGLIATEDGAQTWTWICEQPTSANAALYQLGPAPRSRIIAIALNKVVSSDDRGCTWRAGTGLIEQFLAVDAFPDPVMADRVWAVAVHIDDSGGRDGIYLSQDGGTHFDTRLFEATVDDVISGVESAQSQPQTIYATISKSTPQGFAPAMVRTHDGGKTWEPAALAGLGAGSVRLISVDPKEPKTLVMRWHTLDGEHVALSTDGGDTAHSALDLPSGVLTSYARFPDGRAFLGGVRGVDPVLYTSNDGGRSWTALPKPPNLRALAARGTTLYGAADNVVDGFAVGASEDGGMTWKPLVRFEDVQAIATCVRAACGGACLTEVDLGIWEENVCNATAMPKPVDGGVLPPTGGSAGGAAGGRAGSGGAGGSGGGDGCACAVPQTAAPFLVATLTAALGLLVAARRRRR